MQKEYKSRFVEIMTKFIVFSVTSGAGTVVDLGVHWLLSARFFTDSYWWGLWISPFISFEQLCMAGADFQAWGPFFLAALCRL